MKQRDERPERPRRRTVLYSGRVQGVGFRWTTRRALASLPVDGYVRNRPDGRVELVLEADGDTLDRAVARVREALGPHIRHEDVHEEPATGEFDGFGIRR